MGLRKDMATAAVEAAGDAPAAGEGKAGGKKKLLLIVVPLVLAGAGAGLWFSGILPGLLGMGGGAAESHAAAPSGPEPARPPAFHELPDIVANLNAPGRRPTYVKLRARLELARAEDVAAVQAAMPRLLDLFQTYLREMRPDELRGSAGTQRLREELIARAGVAIAVPLSGREGPPPRVLDVLFTELLIQ
jgi:flagellar FliL protein